jgi:imidazolonepropionase-like amidohydrolase
LTWINCAGLHEVGYSAPMRRWAASSVILFFAIASLAAQRGPSPLEAIALINASVINIRTGAVQRGATVVLRGGQIESVGPTGSVPSGVRTIDLRNRYVVPGLIDAHVHIASLPQLRQALESGVTTVRSAGVSNFVDVGMRELVKKGFVAGPDVVAAGYHVRPEVAPEMFIDFPS